MTAVEGRPPPRVNLFGARAVVRNEHGRSRGGREGNHPAERGESMHMGYNSHNSEQHEAYYCSLDCTSLCAVSDHHDRRRKTMMADLRAVQGREGAWSTALMSTSFNSPSFSSFGGSLLACSGSAVPRLFDSPVSKNNNAFRTPRSVRGSSTFPLSN